MILSAAEFSDCRRYRYSLTRVWDASRPTVVFVGLNPSTADETVDDPTIRRCINFAKQWKYGGLIVVNLFAFRATDPSVLKRADDPIGPQNDKAIRHHCATAKRVIAAWGVHGSFLNRDADVFSLFTRPFCLGVTKHGAPKHPLYLPSATRLRVFRRPRDVGD